MLNKGSFSSLGVVIPSRRQPRQADFLRRAVASIHNQTAASQVVIRIFIGVDPGESLPGDLAAELAAKGTTAVESHAKLQAAALNAAFRKVDTDLVAILEDDDQWHPTYLEWTLKALRGMAKFVSSTQLEVDDDDQVLCIKDFPTPSGWIMPIDTLREVGGFDESYRWHLDNEWLGRLAEKGIVRAHLVEATAPVELQYMKLRPGLFNVVSFGGPQSMIARHDNAFPLVRRLVHRESGLSRIEADAVLLEQSKQEMKMLRERFGQLPW